MPQNFYELLWIFIIYAFFGWCMEVSYAALNSGKFVNRGFLNGAYCPIYGCGMVIVIAILTPLKDNLLILFIGSFLLTSTLEFITGFVMEKIFHNKWWDYSDLPFNIKGYVCLKFSIYWGLACTFVMDIIHPVIYKFVIGIPHILGIVLIIILMTTFAVDVGITFATIMNFNKHLKVMDEIADNIHKLSDEIGERVYENTTIAVKNTEKIKSTNHEKRKELEELYEKYKENMLNRKFGFNRLMKAFPNMKSHDYGEILEKYRKNLKLSKKQLGKSDD